MRFFDVRVLGVGIVFETSARRIEVLHVRFLGIDAVKPGGCFAIDQVDHRLQRLAFLGGERRWNAFLNQKILNVGTAFSVAKFVRFSVG